MIALLAKLEPSRLTFSSNKLQDQGENSSQIQIVVAEGLQVAVPMAGEGKRPETKRSS